MTAWTMFEVDFRPARGLVRTLRAHVWQVPAFAELARELMHATDQVEDAVVRCRDLTRVLAGVQNPTSVDQILDGIVDQLVNDGQPLPPDEKAAVLAAAKNHKLRLIEATERISSLAEGWNQWQDRARAALEQHRIHVDLEPEDNAP